MAVRGGVCAVYARSVRFVRDPVHVQVRAEHCVLRNSGAAFSGRQPRPHEAKLSRFGRICGGYLGDGGRLMLGGTRLAREKDAPMNVAFRPNVTQAAEGLQRRRFTVAEVEAMVAAGILDADERVEMIGGELVPMSSKGIFHETVKGALADRWIRVRPTTHFVMQETTFRLSDDTFLEPDFVIYPRVDKLKSLSQKNVLLVVEIADSSLGYDRGRKAKVYASFGVRELWVIDAVKRLTYVYLDPGEKATKSPTISPRPSWSPRASRPRFSRCGSTISRTSSGTVAESRRLAAILAAGRADRPPRRRCALARSLNRRRARDGCDPPSHAG